MGNCFLLIYHQNPKSSRNSNPDHTQIGSGMTIILEYNTLSVSD